MRTRLYVDRFSNKLRLRRTDKVIMLTSDSRSALEQRLQVVENAVSHDVVCDALRRLSLYSAATVDHDVISVFASLEWEKSVQRFDDL